MEPPLDIGPPPCPRCATPPQDQYQEYCLECGLRLRRAYPRTWSFWQREMWVPGSPAWLWLVLLALLLVALISGAIVALAATGDDGEERRRGRAAPTTTLEILTGETTFPLTTVQPTTTTPVIPTQTATTRATTPATTTTTATTTSGTVIAWPSGRRGYTVVVASIPTSRGRSAAEAKAREAIGDGLSEVGILNSSDYASLRPGYWVVFSGIHDTLSEAQSALPGVRAAGYPVAYVREIRP